MKSNHQQSNHSLQRIFLLSHMRANTSLISHILGTHPEVNGYYEMHLNYCSNDDLVNQEQAFLINHTIKPNSHYLFDKLLHNNYQLLPEQLTDSTSTVLLSIRNAQQTIKSIVNLFQNKQTPHSYAKPERATQYYIDRLRKLAEFCECYKKRYFYFDAELIRKDTENTLLTLQRWLSLSAPLTEEYQLFKMTGHVWVGDSSENMTKGIVVKQESNYDDINISKQLIEKAASETQSFKDSVIKHAIEAITL